MRNAWAASMILLASMGLWMGLVGCVVEPEAPVATGTPPLALPTRDAVELIVMEDLEYLPSRVSIPRTHSVTWINRDDVEHTVTSDGGLFDSGVLANGEEFTYTFDELGTFEYHCEIHPEMTGLVEVMTELTPTPTTTGSG